MDTKILGRFGEEKAADYLRKQGFRITEQNFRCRFGEIDIIAENSELIVFAEVKLRKNSDHGQAREFVNYSKQRKIISTARYYLSENESDKQARFDVIEVYAPNGVFGKYTLNHIEDAFM